MSLENLKLVSVKIINNPNLSDDLKINVACDEVYKFCLETISYLESIQCLTLIERTETKKTFLDKFFGANEYEILESSINSQ